MWWRNRCHSAMGTHVPPPQISPAWGFFSSSSSSLSLSLSVTLSCSVADCPQDLAQCFAYLTLRGGECQAGLDFSRQQPSRHTPLRRSSHGLYSFSCMRCPFPSSGHVKRRFLSFLLSVAQHPSVRWTGIAAVGDLSATTHRPCVEIVLSVRH